MAEEHQDGNPQDAQPKDAQETKRMEPVAQGAGAGEQPTETIDPSAVRASEPTPTTAMPAQPAGETVPDYASAKGERTVVSPAPASDGTASEGASRPAPEYGAYGPTPTQPTQNAAPRYDAPQGQPVQPAYGQYANPDQNRNPYLFGAPAPTGQPQQPANGNPFAQNDRNPYGQQQHDQQRNANPFGNPFRRDAGQQPGQQPQPGQNGQAHPAEKKPMSATARTVITAATAAVLSAALCLGAGYAAIANGLITLPSSNSLTSVDSSKSGSGTAKVASGEAPDWQAVAQNVSGSVVSIQTVMENGTAAGSGAVLDTEGHIVTNNHVISGATQIQVTLSNGQMYSAQIVGTDTTTDLAVLKIDNPPSDLKPVEFADSDDLAVGENIMAVGNPLGYDDTATTGIVSALNRPVTVMDDDNNDIVTNAVQIDAAINPGNSGGPTFNAAGQVIGINSSIASTSSGSSSSTAGSIGIGFAIPSNLVKRVANEIMENGSVKHVALGVTIKSATVEADGVTRGGAQITTPSTAGGSAVVKGGPADQAGLKVNDTIVAFNGNAVSSNASLLGFVRAAALGDKVTLTIVRDGSTMDVDVTLDQEEETVNGSNRTESNSQNGSGQNGYGQNDGSDGSGQGDSGQGGSDGYGFPFNMW